jgi:hypothetical protein
VTDTSSDMAVSCWMSNFRHIRWANDPEHITARFHDFRRLTGHCRNVLPVADLERVARRLVALFGLGWEPACRAFHEGTQPVRTASVAQVRRPIYTRSVAPWRHCEPALGTLFARLNPTPGHGAEAGSEPPATDRVLGAHPGERRRVPVLPDSIG